MKKYLAIGHFADNKNGTISVAMEAHSVKDFRGQLMGNTFIPYVVITEKKFETLRNLDSFELFEEVKKMTSNYRKWNHIVDYIEQCFDIMEERLNNL